jgi:hypothetical protein
VFEFPAAGPYAPPTDSDDNAPSSFDDNTSAGSVSNAGH